MELSVKKVLILSTFLCCVPALAAAELTEAEKSVAPPIMSNINTLPNSANMSMAKLDLKFNNGTVISPPLTKQILPKNLDFFPLNYGLWRAQKSSLNLADMINNRFDWQKNGQEDSVAFVLLQQTTYNETLSSSALYNYGGFSAETGFVNDNSEQSSGTKFYLQSSLVILNNQHFNIAVSARLDSLDKQNINYFNTNNSFLYEPSFSSTLGIVGSYSLTKKWTLTGAVTATAVNENALENQTFNSKRYNMAVIGTTYSF